jgi:hypothetical protein
MKMKRRLLTIILLSAYSIAFCQNNKKEIEFQFTEYLNSIINHDFEKTVNYISDDFFKIIPKEQVILGMERTFNNPDMQVSIREPKVKEISDIELIDMKYYSLLTYSSLINIGFRINDSIKETAEEHNSRMELSKNTLIQIYGEKYVQYDSKTEIFEIYSEKQAYAISENGTTGWKFVVIEKKLKPLLEKFIPKQLIEKI